MFSRRGFVFGAAAASVTFGNDGFTADIPFGGTADEALFVGRPVVLGPDYRSRSVPGIGERGVSPATPAEEAAAKRILDDAPTSSPHAVMSYFADLPYVNQDGEAYNAGWRDRWNPVIVAFFQETSTTPSGDTTAWCAAFLNWCLARANYRGGTGSASSGTFRNARGLTSNPAAGDIVVFKKTGAQGCSGHVGLVVRRTSRQIEVLGGNQTDISGHHSINRKWLDISGANLTLHSYHRVGSLKTPVSPSPTCP